MSIAARKTLAGVDDVSSLPPLLLTAIWSLLPTSTHHAYVCSAGSQGYHALKEMLQNGMPGHTLLLESGDLRDVGCSGGLAEVKGASPLRGDGEVETKRCCCMIYTYQPAFQPEMPPYHITPTVSHLTVYTNHEFLPEMGIMPGGDKLVSVDIIVLNGSRMTMMGVGGSFLIGCTLLKAIDLTPLSNVTVIQNAFMKGCSSLTALDLTPLFNVAEIKGSFLEGCRSLVSLDMSPLIRLRLIGPSFLRYCMGLQQPPLLPHPYRVDHHAPKDHFSTSSTTSTTIAPRFSEITQINDAFLAFCSKLTSLDLTPLANVTTVKGAFLQGCTGLTELDLSPLSRLTVIEGMFLSGCSGLKSLDLSPLSNVTEIKWFFLDTCMGLTTLDLSPLRSVTKVGSHFLQGCSGLTTLNLSPLSNVLADDFTSPLLVGCTSLKEILSPPPSLCG